MFKIVKDRIQQIEKDRRKMSKIHHENYNKTKEMIEFHRNKSEKSDIQKHVEKELSRHF